LGLGGTGGNKEEKKKNIFGKWWNTGVATNRGRKKGGVLSRHLLTSLQVDPNVLLKTYQKEQLVEVPENCDRQTSVSIECLATP